MEKYMYAAAMCRRYNQGLDVGRSATPAAGERGFIASAFGVSRQAAARCRGGSAVALADRGVAVMPSHDNRVALARRAAELLLDGFLGFDPDAVLFHPVGRRGQVGTKLGARRQLDLRATGLIGVKRFAELPPSHRPVIVEFQLAGCIAADADMVAVIGDIFGLII